MSSSPNTTCLAGAWRTPRRYALPLPNAAWCVFKSITTPASTHRAPMNQSSANQDITVPWEDRPRLYAPKGTIVHWEHFLLDIVVVLVVARPFLSGWISYLRRGKLNIGARSRGQLEPDSEKATKCRGKNTPAVHIDTNLDISRFFNPTGSRSAFTGNEVVFRGLSMRPTGSDIETLCPQDGVIPAGCFLGVMGPSGSATLVNILTGRVKPTTGSILIDGHATQAAELRDVLALVPQDDIILPDMTVRENILHSSRLRIGGSWKDSEIQEFIDHLISRLGLDHVCDRLVGEVGEKGISGGERKRVNIALELAAAPSIIVCDEPTSGLDAKSAFSLINLLKSLKEYSVTVICVLHQPRPEIFASLDNLLLLDYGRQIYFGAAAAAQQCFEDAGHHFPTSVNPADAIIDIISSHDKINKIQASKSVSESAQHNSPSSLQSIKLRRAPWYRQVLLTLLRGLKQQTRQYPSFILEILTGAGTGLLIGMSNYEFNGHLFQGLFHPPFQPLSSPVSYRLLTEQGCAAGPAGVRTFGDESAY
ncbi:ABC transporter [Penicillium nucicola]|uniref:ABC transporter n=1 Tax=Penicillium nucicola TaxID=1850975 RepID=UPI00254555FC|nr:ABC transporter [Penicillium nucicola]KAJ5754156.1 ABC transporter [Penicillium nucicola]